MADLDEDEADRMHSIQRLGLFLLTALFIAACGQQPQIQPTVLSLPTLTPSVIPATSTPAPTRIIPSAVETTPQPVASVRFINAAPNAPTLNIFTGFQAVATNLGFGQYTEPTPIEAGNYTLKFIPTEQSSNATPLSEANLNIQGGASLLVIISGSSDNLTLTTLPDGTEALNSGESIVRVIHALKGTGAIVLQNGSDVLTSPVNFGEMTLTGIQPAGSSILEFSSDGKKLADYSADLKEKTEYTLILAGQPESPAIINFKTRAPGRAAVRVINASEQINSVDFYLDDTALSKQVGFGRPTERQNVISGEYTVRIYEAGVDPNSVQPLTSQTISLDAEKVTALIFLGSKAPYTLLSYTENTSPTPSGKARVSFMNVLDNLPIVRLETDAGPIPGTSDLVYGAPPVSTLLDAGSVNFHTDTRDQNGELNSVEIATDLHFEQGLSYLYLISGRSDNNPIILSEKVGVEPDSADGTGLNGASAQIRFINALADQSTIDFLLNGESLLPGMPSQRGSELTAIHDLTPTIQVSADGNSTPAVEQDMTLSADSRYTLIAYGNLPDNVHLLLVPDSNLIFDGRSPHMRLINLSGESYIQLGLATVETSQAPEITLSEADRPFIPRGLQKNIQSVNGGSASGVALMPVGTFNLYVFDPTVDEITAIYASLGLEAGLHYDVIATQSVNEKYGEVFVLTYPASSG